MQMLDQWDLLKQIRFFVLDMDGTFYLGNQIMDGALDFIAKVKESERDFVFFTNNSSKDRMLYVDKLAAMGCICFDNPEMGIYFISDPDGYWLEIVPKEK